MRVKKEIIVTVCACLLIILTVSLGSSIEKVSTTTGTHKSENSQHTQTKVQSKNTNSNDVKKDSSTENKNSTESNTQTKSASYDGIAKGYKGDIKVRVKVDSGKISDIEILETSDDEEYFSKAKNLINDIINNQSTDVEVVSGATFSSNGIIGAVKDALSKGGM